MQKVAQQRVAQKGRSGGDTELPGAAQEIVVAPTGQRAGLLLGVVAEAEADVAGWGFGDPHPHVDDIVRPRYLITEAGVGDRLNTPD